MSNHGSQLPQLSTVPPENVQAYLDALAELSVRFGIIVASGSLMPMYPDVEGYHIAPGGYLFVYERDKRSWIDVAGNWRDELSQQPPFTFSADIAGMTAHDHIRILRGLH